MTEFRNANSNDTSLIRVGARIQELRKSKNLTIEQLAEKCNLSVQSICKIESGSRDFKVSSLTAISMALGVSSDYVLGLSKFSTEDNINCLVSALSPEGKEFIRGVIELVLNSK